MTVVNKRRTSEKHRGAGRRTGAETAACQGGAQGACLLTLEPDFGSHCGSDDKSHHELKRHADNDNSNFRASASATARTHPPRPWADVHEVKCEQWAERKMGTEGWWPKKAAPQEVSTPGIARLRL